ncbi:Rps23 Pro-64 3,4-dihydroxylase Tpa1-like proline 4-hydroxylase [Chitinophaga polysaccharea]|uniref:Rps23 Pro-64 3,4-dihydroxylase Tpa1-like proline 4-hydroxylase n=1 Tax=Chitinophaga polysaccharea TaxID=1293035 RepID=A0A561PUP1_9BACT|nr:MULTISPECIES: 2OG-Fe(II) oxygenase [Chitinophaga]TWF41788.1 Rps23 Pro-64 3,4-dihydroxylase Tpa1-like proline 4-hydroxylase [Chitinophaga polysaccharea]
MQTITETAENTQLFDYDHWNSQLPTLSKDYQGASPYPHIVLENFLNPDVLTTCSQEFDKLNEEDGWINYVHYNENKAGLNKLDLLPATIKRTINELNSPEFLAFLSELTGIKGLMKDDLLEGGGIHQSKRGGYLNIHADFTVHPHHRHWQRRVNVLVYLNPDWVEEWGGKLELWDTQMKACEKKVLPVFNRCVIFNTDADSYHGHPEPTTCPEDRHRRSIALYYYTEEAQPFRRATHYMVRPGEEKKKFMVKLDNTMVAVYTEIKGMLGSNDKVVSKILRFFSGKKKK